MRELESWHGGKESEDNYSPAVEKPGFVAYKLWFYRKLPIHVFYFIKTYLCKLYMPCYLRWSLFKINLRSRVEVTHSYRVRGLSNGTMTFLKLKELVQYKIMA